VLEDYPEDAPPAEGEITTLSCPVDFGQPEVELTETEKLCSAFKKEMTSLRPWYDLVVKKRGRTTVGVSKVDLDGLGDFICSFLGDGIPDNPRDDIALPYTLNLATDDLKAYYSEAITAQPSQESPSSQVLSDWFYGETVAGKVLFAIQDVGRKSEDMLMKILGNALIIPVDQMEKRMKMPSHK
jgi:hypothetical protein